MKTKTISIFISLVFFLQISLFSQISANERTVSQQAVEVKKEVVDITLQPKTQEVQQQEQDVKPEDETAKSGCAHAKNKEACTSSKEGKACCKGDASKACCSSKKTGQSGCAGHKTSAPSDKTTGDAAKTEAPIGRGCCRK